MQSLMQHFNDLFLILKDEKSIALIDPSAVVSDINDFCSKISDDEIGLCSSILFDPEKGLFAWIDKSLLDSTKTDKIYMYTRKGLLELLHIYIKRVGKKISDHALEIKKWCFNIFRRDPSDLVKQSTFQPLIKIIEYQFPHLDAKTLQIKEMFDTYLREYLKGKSRSGVKGSILRILGIISEYYPSEVSQQAPRLLQIYMDTLKEQASKAQPDEQLISSCFIGLECFLTHNGGSVQEGSEFIKPLYIYMTKSLERTDATRHDVVKAAARLLAKHAYQFKEYLTEDSEKMFARLEKLCKHRNEKVRKVAFPALESFLAQVSYELVRGHRRPESNRQTFLTLMSKFRDLLNPNNENRYDTSIAISAFGQFAPPMKKFMGNADTKMILQKLFQFSDHLFTKSQEELEEGVRHLPSLISAFANIIIELDEVDSYIIDDLERVIGVLFLIFPKQFMFPKYRTANYKALVKLFVALYLKQNSLDNLLQRIVFQGLTLTISSSAAINGGAAAGYSTMSSVLTTGAENPSVPLYIDYLGLWTNMLDSRNIELNRWNYPWNELVFNEDLQEHMHSLIYDRIIEAIMKMFDKLELSYTMVTADEASKTTNTDESGADHLVSEAEYILRPQHPRDFELFLNLVEFCREFLPNCKTRHFVRWEYLFGKQLIEKCSKYSYISGFPKLMSECLNIANKHNFFDGITQNTADQLLQHEEGPPTTVIESLFFVPTKTRVNCFHVFDQYLNEVLTRLHEFKGELLVTCLLLVLSVPKQFINLERLIAPLKTALGMGLSYLNLAHAGLDAIERWLRIVPAKEITARLPEILPALNKYLMVNSTEMETKDVVVQTKRKRGTKTFSSRAATPTTPHIPQEVEQPLYKTQLRIIRLLGSIGGENVHVLATEGIESSTSQFIAWDTSKRVNFSLPFRDTKPEIFFDAVLPRIVELAEKSSDRQVKLAACEFLHSVVLYMVGKNAYSPAVRQRAQQQQRQSARGVKKEDEEESDEEETNTEPTPFYKIYTKIFPTLLRLSVDTEPVARQLFEPMVSQLVHWFTQNIRFENRETMALLDAIIEGLSNPKDGALRDICAGLVGEFLRWSVKHAKKNKLANVKSLFQRLYSLFQHPNVHKRLGAALAFNRMYRIFREVDEIVEMHVLDLLHNTVRSLKMAHKDDILIGTVAKTVELLGHLEKIIVYKSKLLLEHKVQRGYHPNLEHAVNWLFEQCASNEPACRQQCMKLFTTLCMLLPEFGTEDGPRRWLHMKIKKDPYFALRVIDQISTPSPPLPDQVQNMLIVGEDASQAKRVRVEDVGQWLTELETSLDCYSWVFSQQYLYPHQLLLQKSDASTAEKDTKQKAAKKIKSEEGVKMEEEQQTQHAESRLLEHLRVFVEKLALASIGEFFNLSGDQLNVAISPHERARFNNKKCSVVLKALEFMALMCDKYRETLSQLPSEKQVLGPYFYELLFMCVLKPQEVGFDLDQVSSETGQAIHQVLLRVCKQLCTALVQHKFNEEQKRMLHGVLQPILVERETNVLRINVLTTTLAVSEATFLARGYRLLNAVGLLEPNIQKQTGKTILDIALGLGQELFNIETTLTPVQLLIARELWDLCFDFGFPNDVLLQYLMDDSEWGKNNPLSVQMSRVEIDSNLMTDVDHSGGERVKAATKGLVFYKNYQEEIDGHIYKHIADFARDLVALAKDKPFAFALILNIGNIALRRRKQHPVTFVVEISKHIKELADKITGVSGSDAEFQFRTNVAKLFDLLLKLDAKTLLDDKNNRQSFDTVIAFYTSALRARDDNRQHFVLPQKIQALRACPYILDTLKHTPYLKVILDDINNIVIYDFPIKSTDLPKGSAVLDNYLTLLEELLDCLSNSHTVDLLEVVLPVFREKEHPRKEKMATALKSFFAKLSAEAILQAGTICVKTFLDESLPTDMRKSAIQRVCLACLSRMTRNSLVLFFEEHVKELTAIVMRPTKFDSTTTVEDFQAQVVTKTCAFNLLEAMYRLLPATDIKESINKKYVGDGTATGKELTEKVMRAAFSARTYLPSEAEKVALGSELLLDFHCSAYNALASVVMCTQTQEKFYTGFLFKDSKNDLWHNIVDLDKTYNFEVETNFDYSRKAVDELRLDTQKSARTEGGQRIQYLSSQYLAESSLSQDLPYIGSFFGTPSSLKKQTSTATQETNKEQPVQQRDAAPSSSSTAQECQDEPLEMDEINLNPCMTTILRLIDYMHKNFQAPQGSMPAWMSSIHASLANEETHPNIRLFLAKVIINRPSVFEPYAKDFFAPLVSLAVSKNNGGSGLHYFVRDICVLLLRWNVLPPDDAKGRQLAAALLEYIMKNASHMKRLVLRANLEIIKIMVEKWKSRITIPKDVILGWICFDEKKPEAKNARMTGLQLLGVVLANDLPAYDKDNDSRLLPESKFYDKVIDNLSFPAKDVYEAAAEVCGMTLLQMASSNKPDAEASIEILEKSLVAKLSTFLIKHQVDRFLNSLNKIGLHYPSFLDHFLPARVIDLLPNLYGIYKSIALQVIVIRAESVPDLFMTLKPYLKSLLQHRDDDVQLMTFKITFKLLKLLDSADIMSFLNLISEVTDNNNNEIFHSLFNENCRLLYYDILVWLYDNKEGMNQVDRVRLPLLYGLMDESEYVRKKLLEFWDQESRLSLEALRRLEQTFRLLYSEQLGDNWLKYSAYLMLQLLHRSPDFSDNKALFETGLAQCEFREYKVDPTIGSLASKGPSFLQPSFVSSQVDSTLTPMDTDGDVGMIRATLVPQFSLTQIAEPSPMSIENPTLTQTSLLFVPFKKPAATSAEGGYGQQQQQQIETAEEQKMRLRRRFIKQTESLATQHHAQRATRMKREREAWESRQKVARLNKVVMYRKYRTGELPDIQISIKDFILPLQSLAVADVQIARALLGDIFNAAYPEIMDKLVARDALEIKTNLQAQINKMLRSSKDCPSLIAFIFSLCFEHDELRHKVAPELIGEVSLKSSNLETGALLVEKNIKELESGPNTSAPKSRGRRSRAASQASQQEIEVDEPTTNETPEQIEEKKSTLWLELGKIYKAMQEEDIVLAIFENKFAQQQHTRAALEAEMSGDYTTAYKQFSSALDEWYQNRDAWDENLIPKPTQHEIEYWTTERLECLRKMTKWSDLRSEVISEVCGSGEQQLRPISDIWKPEYVDRLLPMYLESHIKLKESWKDLEAFVEAALNDPEKRELLETKHSSEMAQLTIYIKDYKERAKYYIINCYEQFISAWNSLSVLAKTGRHLKLQQLEKLVEIEEFIDIFNPNSTGTSSDPLAASSGFSRLMRRWKSRFPSPKIDDMNVWDDVMWNRSVLFEKIHKHMSNVLANTTNRQSNNDAETNKILTLAEVNKSISEETARMYLVASKAARTQNNYNVAQGFLKVAQDTRKKLAALQQQEGATSTSDSNFDFTFFESLVKLLRIKAFKRTDIDDSLNLYKKAVQYIQQHGKEEQITSNPDNAIVYNLLLADSFAEIANKMLDAQKREGPLGSVDAAVQKALQFYKKAVEESDKQEEGSARNNESKRAKTYMQLAAFCDEQLRRLQNENEQPGTQQLTREQLAQSVMQNYLRAMKCDSKRARQHFPRLLELLEKYPQTTRSIFAELTKQIPSWMFIAWISQTLSYMGGSEAKYLVDAVLGRIADDYPQALYYSYRISKEDLIAKKKKSKDLLHALELLDFKLLNPLLDQFVAALEKLTHPELRWKYWLDEIKHPLKRGDDEEVLRIWREAFDDMFDPTIPNIGVYNQKFATVWAPLIKKEYGGRDGKKLLTFKGTNNFEFTAMQKYQKMRETKGAMLAGPTKLNYFSGWLADYQQSAESMTNAYIELPGQYTGNSKPQVELHVKVVSFDPNLLTMSSVRRPKRLKIRGDDERDHPYLVKGCEDLRQDQRIEQIFALMNELLRSDSACAKRDLYVKTYQVVPMTKKVGILEWVDNTMLLKAIIEQELAKDMKVPKADLLKHPATQKHLDMIMKCSAPNLRQPQCYLRMFQKMTRDDVHNVLKEQWAMLRGDLLQRGVESLCASQEAYFNIRNQFARSLAVVSMCSYVLGIGDRHLENFLLDYKDGRVLAIDFGHAFGSATESLPIPELMPFRLTRQLTDMLPLQSNGLVKQSMVHAMTALHENRHVLLSIMDVFVKEPLVDWLKHAKIRATNQNTTAKKVSIKKEEGEETGDVNVDDEAEEEAEHNAEKWYPLKKIGLARRKLEMANPLYITLEELKGNAMAQPAYKYIERVVKGDPAYNPRARVGERCASIREQVDCLIDQATDPNILGRTYVGWAGWV